MATIRDVAKLAGVSVATVSRVLNKKGYVHEDTVKQVEKAIEALQYRPNAVAKALFKKTSTMIAILVSDLQKPSFFELLSTIEQTAYEAGYQVVVCNVHDKQSTVDNLLQNNISGFLVMSEVYEHIKGVIQSAPFVVVDGEATEGYSTVCSYDYDGARAAVQHLVEGGSSFLAHIRGPKGHVAMDERYEGFVDTAEEYNMPYRVVQGELSVSGGEQAFRELLQSAPYVNGVLACSDIVAIGAIRAAHQLHVSIPGQLQIVGFDGMAESACIYPSLTTVAQPYKKKGALATKLLLQHIKDRTAARSIYRLSPALVVRESTRV